MTPRKGKATGGEEDQQNTLNSRVIDLKKDSHLWRSRVEALIDEKKSW